MNRRVTLKLKNMKMFCKKYIFNSRFIVRNTMVVAGVVAVAGTAAVVGTVIKENAKAAEVESASISESVDASLTTASNEQYVINLSDTKLLDVDSLSILADGVIAENQVSIEANKLESLSNSKFDMTGKFLSTGDAINIRKTADANGELVGILPQGATGDVLSVSGDWTEIQSGEVTGYVASSYIITDEEATEVAEDMQVKIATVSISQAKVREEADKDADVLYLASSGATFPVVDAEGDYKEIELADCSRAFVAADCITEVDGFKTAISIADVDALTAAKSYYAESTRETTVASNDTKTEATTETKKTTDSAATATTTATTEATTAASTTETTVEVSTDDVTLLAAIVFAEAGNQSYEGQLAVANVVLNRLRSGRYGSSLSAVIYAPSQFTASTTSAFYGALSNPNSTSLAAAQDALAGNNNVPGYYNFRPTWTGASGYVIGDHVFF